MGIDCVFKPCNRPVYPASAVPLCICATDGENCRTTRRLELTRENSGGNPQINFQQLLYPPPHGGVKNKQDHPQSCSGPLTFIIVSMHLTARPKQLHILCVAQHLARKKNNVSLVSKQQAWEPADTVRSKLLVRPLFLVYFLHQIKNRILLFRMGPTQTKAAFPHLALAPNRTAVLLSHNKP